MDLNTKSCLLWEHGSVKGVGVGTLFLVNIGTLTVTLDIFMEITI